MTVGWFVFVLSDLLADSLVDSLVDLFLLADLFSFRLIYVRGTGYRKVRRGAEGARVRSEQGKLKILISYPNQNCDPSS